MRMNSNEKANWCLILLGIPFFIGGTGVFILGLTMLMDAVRAESWEKTPANIIELDVKTNGYSYFIETLYKYTYNDEQYQSTRFTLVKSFEEKSVQKALIGQVKSRIPPYCFVNPDNPSESVLLKSLPQSVNLFIPIGMCFMLVGGGLLGGSIQSSLYNRKAADMFKRTGKIPIDKIKSRSVLILVPLVTGFILSFINVLIVSPIFGPVNTILFSLAIMILSLYAGWKWSGRYNTNVELEIITPPGRDQEFKVSLQFLENETGEKRNTAEFTNMSMTAALEVYIYDDSNADGDNSKKILLSVPFKNGEVYKRRRYFFINAGSARSIKTADIEQPGDNVPQFVKKFVGLLKRTRWYYKEYVKPFEIAGKIATALQGGPDAKDAAAEVYNALDSGDSNKKIHVNIQITGDMNLTFPLPPDIWARDRSLGR
jgi:hypothetical protein